MLQGGGKEGYNHHSNDNLHEGEVDVLLIVNGGFRCRVLNVNDGCEWMWVMWL